MKINTNMMIAGIVMVLYGLSLFITFKQEYIVLNGIGVGLSSAGIMNIILSFRKEVG